VDGRHQTFDDAVLVVDNLGDGCEAVGGAGSIGDLADLTFERRKGKHMHRRYVPLCSKDRTYPG
jgi:hypothetical protein